MEKTKSKGGIHVGKLLNFAVPVISVLLAFLIMLGITALDTMKGPFKSTSIT